MQLEKSVHIYVQELRNYAVQGCHDVMTSGAVKSLQNLFFSKRSYCKI